MKKLLAAASFIAIAGLCGQANAAVTFTDSTFNTASYLATTAFTDPGSVILFGHCASCGNPGAAGSFLEFFGPTTTPGDAVLGEINSSFVYNPSVSGAIGNIATSVDKNISVSPLGALGQMGGSITNTYHPLIEQGGIYYWSSIALPTISLPANGVYSTGFETASGTLNASSFVEIDFSTYTIGTAHPDFSASGAPIYFGLAQAAGAFSSEMLDQDYDNLKFTISAVPEPEVWAMMMMGLGAMGLVLRGRRKSAAVAA